MTGVEVTLLVVALAAVAGVLLLALVLRSVVRAMRRLEHTVERLHAEALRAVPLATTEPGAAGDQLDGRPRDAGSLLARVAVANPYLDVSDPVIKVLAFASGTSRAASRLRHRRREA